MPNQRGHGQYGRPKYNQARKIVAKFGGEAALAKTLGVSRITAYRWQMSRPYGTDGLIPSSAVESVNKAARLEGIVLTAQDWLAERIDYPEAAE